MTSTAEQQVLALEHVSKRFGKTLANDDISLALSKGEILALLGENGAGKTTLMNILFGHYVADTGSITVNGNSLHRHTPADALAAGVGMVHQHFTLADSQTVIDNILLGTESLWRPLSARRRARVKLERLINDAGLAVSLDAPVRDLNVGERQRVEILKALYRDVTVLILDEPTAVLTPQEVDDLFELLRRMVANGLSIILISHKLNEVLSVSDRIVVLRHGTVAGETLTQDVNKQQLAEMIVGRPIERPMLKKTRRGKPLLNLSKVNLGDVKSSRVLLDNIDLQLHEHEIIGIAGVSGNGQQSLANVLSGIASKVSGTITLRGEPYASTTPRALTSHGVARIPEDRHRDGIVGELSVWENLLLDDIGEPPCWRYGTVLDRRAARARSVELVASFDVRCANDEQSAQLLSGGNIQKLILARNLSRSPSVILANQPSRGLDEGAIATVQMHLLEARNRGAGVILISEDLEELLALSDTVHVMLKGRLSEAISAATLDVRELGARMTGGIE